MFYKKLISIEAELLNINRGKQAALGKARAALSLVSQAAGYLNETESKGYPMIQNDYHSYHHLQYRVMVYLLYFDWQVGYLEGRCDEVQPCLADKLPNGAYERWKKARQEAQTMRQEYMKQAMMQE